MSTPPRPLTDVTHTTLSVLFLALLAASTFWVLSPFLTAILWATVVTVAAWPLFLRLERAVGRKRWIAVTIVTATILIVVFVPVTLAVTTIVKNAHSITSDIRLFESISLPAPPAALERIPIFGARLAAKWRHFTMLSPDERVEIVAPYAQSALQWFAVKAGGLGAMLIEFVLTAIVSAILFARGEIAREGILRFATRLGGRQGHDAAILAALTIRGVVLGVVGTALIQTAVGGAGLLITGVPAPALLSAVMLFCCLAQIGPLLVLAPAVVWLYWSGSSGWGTTLLVFTIVAATLDNFIRPVLIRRGAKLPLLLIFAGVIGGLLAFGVIGIFIGPVVLSVTYTLLSNWVSSDVVRSEMAS